MWLQMELFYPFLRLHSIPCVYGPRRLNPFLCRWTSIVNSDAVNTGVRASFSITVFSGDTPRSGVAGSRGSSPPSLALH